MVRGRSKFCVHVRRPILIDVDWFLFLVFVFSQKREAIAKEKVPNLMTHMWIFLLTLSTLASLFELHLIHSFTSLSDKCIPSFFRLNLRDTWICLDSLHLFVCLWKGQKRLLIWQRKGNTQTLYLQWSRTLAPETRVHFVLSTISFFLVIVRRHHSSLPWFTYFSSFRDSNYRVTRERTDKSKQIE